jgi:peptidoglycan/LPS O-acetylase OafA/YrhL
MIAASAERSTNRTVKSGRNIGLDLLRLLAVLLVMGAHFREVPHAGVAFFRSWNRRGWIGVDLFFVLSGFLVSGLLFDEYARSRRLDIGRFLIRRGWKIYPAFWLLIAFTLALPTIFGRTPPAPVTLSALTAELLFFQNYVPGLWGHTWSLAVEEHFYIGLALLFAWLVGRKHATDPFSLVPYIFVVLATTCFFLRVATEFINHEKPYDWFAYCGSHLRIDSLFFGVLLAYLCRFHNLTTLMACVPTFSLVAAAVLLLLPAFFVDIGRHHWCWSGLVIMLYLGGGMLVIASTRLPASRNPVLVGLASLGAAS